MKIKKDNFEHNYIEISHLFNTLGDNEKVYVVRLPKFEKILLTEVQPEKDFGFEIFEKCNLITGVQYNEMFHSGEIKPESIRRKNEATSLFINASTDKEIRKILNLKEGDAYIAARGSEKPVLHTMKKTIERCKQAFDGVPQETRRVLPNGNNEFLRVIHGKERLYPDTDTPLVPYPMEKYEQIRNKPLNRPLELLAKYGEQGLTMDKLELIIREEKTRLFIKMVDENNIGLPLAYQLLIEIPRWLARKGAAPENISMDLLNAVAAAINKSEMPGSKLRPLMFDLATALNDKDRYEILAKYIAAAQKEGKK